MALLTRRCLYIFCKTPGESESHEQKNGGKDGKNNFSTEEQQLCSGGEKSQRDTTDTDQRSADTHPDTSFRRLAATSDNTRTNAVSWFDNVEVYVSGRSNDPL